MIITETLMQNPTSVVILVDDNTCLRYFHPVISLLIKSNKHHLAIVARTEEIACDVIKHFPEILHLKTGYSIDSFVAVEPDIVICYQIWWWGIASFLELFVKCNIPILQYDHGSLIYLSEFLLENNEYATNYRNNVYRCSHIACWGERGKECWVSYGVPEEKLFLTGAIHLDGLPSVPDGSNIYETLQLPEDKIIIFLYSAFTGQLPHFETAQIQYIERLVSYVAANPRYQLVIKPHPTEMLEFDRPHNCYSKTAKLIANPIEDCHWPEIIRISSDDVVSASAVVVSPFSSALLTPFSLNIPVVLLQYESSRVVDFVNFCKDSIVAISSAEQIPQAIEQAVCTTEFDCSLLASKLNHLNDRNACTRFIDLMNKILEEKKTGKNFYPQEEDELMLSVRRYPFLPYPYQHLIKFYMNKGDDSNVDYWLNQYLTKFKDPSSILKDMAHHFSNIRKDLEKVKRYLTIYSKYTSLDNELLQMFYESNYDTNVRINGI